MSTKKDKCIKDDDGNVIDPISYDIIPEEYIVQVSEGDETRCFDVRSLHENYVRTGNLINPFTREQLPQNVRDEIMHYDKFISVTVAAIFEDTGKKLIFDFSSVNNYGDLIVSIFSQIGRLSDIMLYDIHVISNENESLYTYNLDDNINLGKKINLVLSKELSKSNIEKLRSYLIKRNDRHTEGVIGIIDEILDDLAGPEDDLRYPELLSLIGECNVQGFKSLMSSDPDVITYFNFIDTIFYISESCTGPSKNSIMEYLFSGVGLLQVVLAPELEISPDNTLLDMVLLFPPNSVSSKSVKRALVTRLAIMTGTYDERINRILSV